MGPQGPLVGETVPSQPAATTTATAAREAGRAYADVAMTARGDEQRDVRQAGEPRDVPTDDLHDGGGDRQGHHDERCHAADRERGAEEHRGEPGPGPHLGLDEPDDHGERGSRGHVDEQSRRLGPSASPHRSVVIVLMGRVWPSARSRRLLPHPVSESRERLSVVGCRMVS